MVILSKYWKCCELLVLFAWSVALFYCVSLDVVSTVMYLYSHVKSNGDRVLLRPHYIGYTSLMLLLLLFFYFCWFQHHSVIVFLPGLICFTKSYVFGVARRLRHWQRVSCLIFGVSDMSRILLETRSQVWLI